MPEAKLPNGLIDSDWLIVQTGTILAVKRNGFNNYGRKRGLKQPCPGQTELMITLILNWRVVGLMKRPWALHKDSKTLSSL